MSKFDKAKERIQSFYRETDQKIILLHKPHPGDIMKPGAVKQLIDYLEQIGEL